MDGGKVQLGFDFGSAGPTIQPELIDGATIGEQFEAFHFCNPHVYLAIVSVAREFKRQGRIRCSMKLIYETLREKLRQTQRADKWKLNNNYTAHYARKVMERESDLDGFF